jgi:hypothetical protein
MKKGTIAILLAASAVFLIGSGGGKAAALQKKEKAQTIKALPRFQRGAQVQAVNVIPNPPPGWSTPVNISNLPAESIWPTLAVDNNGKAYAVWEEWYGGVGAPRSMAFTTNYSGAWAPAQENPLSYVTIDDTGYVTVACDPWNGNAYMGYHDADWANMNMEVVFVEFDKGVKTSEDFISKTAGASDYTTLAVDPNTSMVYCMWFDDLTGRDIFELAYRWRDPDTKQWSSGGIVPVFLGRSKYWRDMVIDKTGTAHLVFNLRSPTEVWYTKNPTPENDAAWTTPISVSGNTDLDWTWPRLAVDDDGDVYVTWCRNTGGYESETEEVWFRRTVGGVWQAPENLSNSTTRSGEMYGAAIAVDPESKDVWVAWHEFVNNANWEIYLRMYSEQDGGGKAWGDIYNMSNSPTESGQPSLRMDAQGGLHLIYYDDVAGGNREILYTQKPGIGAPLSVAVETTLNATEDQKTNTITWAANPSNASLNIANYKVYWKKASEPEGSFAQLTSVSNSTFSYAHTVPSVTERYDYRVASVTSAGAEGVSATVEDKAGVFAPVNVSVETKVDKILFYEIKDNVISFAPSSNNAAADVAGYNIYRRKANEENTAMTLLSSVDAATFSYTDAEIRGGQKYAYAVTTIFKDGREGNFSTVVTEK